MKTKGLRANESIHVEQVRLVSEKGEQLGIVPIADAQKAAVEAGLDLVEVAPNSDPPVCRVMDYGRYKYERKKRQHGSHKKHHVSQLKELRLRPKTDTHDIGIKMDRARKVLERGDRVMITMMFRGREVAHANLGREILANFANGLEDIGKVEKTPTMESRRMSMILVRK